MPQFSFLSAFGLDNVAVYKMDFSQNKPIEGQKKERLSFPEVKGNQTTRLNPTGIGSEQAYGLFGLTVFSDLILINPTNAADKVHILGVLFNLTATKNIDTVAVQNVDGTIKTHINDGDIDIKIRCWLSTDNANDYPIEAVTQLKKLLKLKTALKVQSDFLLLFDIYNIVVTDYNVFQVEGVQNTQFFEISALSDKPVELISDVQTNQ